MGRGCLVKSESNFFCLPFLSSIPVLPIHVSTGVLMFPQVCVCPCYCARTKYNAKVMFLQFLSFLLFTGGGESSTRKCSCLGHWAEKCQCPERGRVMSQNTLQFDYISIMHCSLPVIRLGYYCAQTPPIWTCALFPPSDIGTTAVRGKQSRLELPSCFYCTHRVCRYYANMQVWLDTAKKKNTMMTFSFEADFAFCKLAFNIAEANSEPVASVANNVENPSFSANCIECTIFESSHFVIW